MECNIMKLLEKVKKIWDIFSRVTIGTNVTKGVSMIIQASLESSTICKECNNGFWCVCKSL